MIFNIYEQSDLFQIAGCKRKSTLESWLRMNTIPFTTNARDEIIAHEKAVEAGLGVRAPDPARKPKPKMGL